jgi:hypothetical protein
MKNTANIEAAKAAITGIHSNTDVPLQQTLDDLHEVRDHLTELIEAVEADLNREEGEE